MVAALEASGCGRAHAPELKPAAIQRIEEHRPWSLSPPIAVSMPDEAVVHVVSKGVGCSGTLITNSLVLTAHHCVVQRTP
ncbi:MAG TPA: trypsin-like serine protease, partial [Polyangiaceae bacterium]|nr:trypsin-like serine protease [Polyangiaceae bacterium]